MRRMTIMGLAKATLLATLGLLPSSDMLAQGVQTPYRIPEPTGVPVQRYRNSKFDGRPFSADYYAAWQRRLAEQKEWMKLEELRRSEPPVVRATRQTDLDLRNRQISARQAKIRGDARPSYVVHQRATQAKPSLIGADQIVNDAPALAAKPAWTITQSLRNPFKAKEPEGIVRSVEVIAEYPVESAPRGLLARFLPQNESEIQYTSEEEPPAAVVSTPAQESWSDAEPATVVQDVVVDEHGVVISPVMDEPVEPQFEEEPVPAPRTIRPVSTTPSSKRPAPSRLRTVPYSEPQASLSLPMPDLPIEDAIVESVEVIPVAVRAMSAGKIQKINWTVTEADFLDIQAVPVLPDLDAIPDNLTNANPVVVKLPKVTRKRIQPLEPSELPNIPEDVLKKYKAN